MKKIVLFLTCLAACVTLSAQQRNYLLTRGKTTENVSWNLKKTDVGYELSVVLSNRTSLHKIDFSGRTTEWHNIIKSEDTDYTIKYENGGYVISGKKDGKPYYKTIESKLPWYQDICFSIPIIMQLKEGNNVKYENFSPKDGKCYSMTATIGSTSKIGSHTVCELHCASAGVFSGFWTSDYYIDTTTKEFISYTAVEGVPGTPRTRWLLQE